jgi:hypothetical protein
MKQVVHRLLGMFAVLGVVAAQSSTALAAFGFTPPRNQNVTNTGQNYQQALNPVVQRIINIIFYFAGVVAVLYLLVSAFQYITAGGNADQVKNARAGIINAVIGIIILFAAFAIVRFAGILGTGVSTI